MHLVGASGFFTCLNTYSSRCNRQLRFQRNRCLALWRETIQLCEWLDPASRASETRSITLLYKGPYNVTLDNQTTTFDGFAPGNTQFRVPLFGTSGLAPGHHTIQLINSPINSTMPFIDLDFVRICRFASNQQHSNPFPKHRPTRLDANSAINY